VVLKVLAESEQVVSAGMPLVEIGDPTDMEIVVHLLSADAVRIAPGSSATITDWGGPEILQAKVRSTEPAAYTKVSALGIEEQRVDATLDLVDESHEWQGLGHEFRVMVNIAIWEGSDVLRVPLAALFRVGSDWTVYRVVDGRAVATPVDIGHRNTRNAEVLSGLSEGDAVILHPSDQISDEKTVVARE
jgi:HlyD family secretion protein